MPVDIPFLYAMISLTGLKITLPLSEPGPFLNLTVKLEIVTEMEIQMKILQAGFDIVLINVMT